MASVARVTFPCYTEDMTNTTRTTEEIIEAVSEDDLDVYDIIRLAREGMAPIDTQVVERRVTYSYGVNKNQRMTLQSATYDEIRQRVESATMGPVDVDLREFRTVTFGPWTVES